MELALSYMLDNSLITHSCDENGQLFITLSLVCSNAHIANIIYYPHFQTVEILFVKKDYFTLVMQKFDLVISWLKAYSIALENVALQQTSVTRMHSC